MLLDAQRFFNRSFSINVICELKHNVNTRRKFKIKDWPTIMLVNRNDKPKISSEEVTHFIDDYEKRRKTQMTRFFGITIFTLITCRIAMKKMITAKVPLNTFQANYASRTQTITHTQKSLAGSLLAATGMTLGIFGMGITGTCWSWDVSSFQELKQRLERRANNEFVVTNMPLDKRSQQVVDSLVKTHNSSLCK
ncbi:BAH_G0001380.mRNA.1.CDS.1 [Saccharomyces cerevisiae]|nr:BAH_G0001380.mRNA.1.CDS.1 [Saccharomyces cerevisiae]CAI7038187.1 BAH_G0001380.mRNA.1.CDS.1 [Saccharomyces cerevisiae]